MAKVHRFARVRAFQALFEAEFGRRSALEALRGEEGGELLGAAEGAYAAVLVQGVTECRQTLDQIIGETAPAWPVEQLSAVDRTLLRIALYELLFNNAAVPPGAVINEAVELAKRFGSDASRRFVNGVLGTVSRERLASAAGELSKREGVREPD